MKFKRLTSGPGLVSALLALSVNGWPAEMVREGDAPVRVYNVLRFGAKGDGTTLDTESIQKALDACGKEGGGRVEFPSGTYLSKPIFLPSHTTLTLDAGAILQATDNPADFASRSNRGAVVNFINASGVEGVGIEGKGTIDGAGARWWGPAREAKRLNEPETQRRPRLVTFANCTNVHVAGVTLQNSPSFHLVPSDCENVEIVGVTILAPADSPNTDAIDPSACRHVSIRNCVIDVGDDNIAIKSGHPDRQRRGAACEDIVVSGCTFRHGHGMSIGSETLGGVRNLVVSNCTFEGTISGIRIKSSRERGGVVENLVYRDLTMTNVDRPIDFSGYYPKIPAEDTNAAVKATTPIYRNIVIENLIGRGTREAGVIVGLPECCISNVVLRNVHLVAPKGITVRNAQAIEFKDSSIRARTGPGLILETNASVQGWESR